ncbi:MAG: permease [Roseibium sp.]
MASPDQDQKNGQLVPDIGSARRPDRPKRRLFDTGFLLVLAVAVVSGTLVWRRDGAARVQEILASGFDLVVSIGPKVMAAVLLAAWLRLLLPKEKISRHFGGKQGVRGMSLAVIVGVILPGGPMTAFPLSVAFFQAGAGFGVIVAFLSSWLLLGANRTIVWEMAFLDYHLVGLRYGVCLPLPFLFGWLAQVFEHRSPRLFRKVARWH